jgi:hypothetical protein
LSDKEDIAQGLPKAVAAVRKLKRVNSIVVTQDWKTQKNRSD